MWNSGSRASVKFVQSPAVNSAMIPSTALATPRIPTEADTATSPILMLCIPDDTKVSRTQCVYPANPVFELALCALLLLVVALIIASAAGDCCGCCRPRTGASKTKRVMGIVASVLSW
ncbi:hypothetical protein EJB05_35691, partial [Eragrostis curvula]